MSQDAVKTDQVEGQLALDPGESSAINNLKQRANALMAETGRIEIEKQRALMGFFDAEIRCQEILTRAQQRIGIPTGTVWQVDEHGKVFFQTEEGKVPMTKDHIPGPEAAVDQPQQEE